MPQDPKTLASKVAHVTFAFWVIKILSTTTGETFADYLNVDVGQVDPRCSGHLSLHYKDTLSQEVDKSRAYLEKSRREDVREALQAPAGEVVL